MPEISDAELQEYRGLQSKVVGLELDGAKSSFRAENPHVPAALVTAYQGDPAGLADFGKVLLEQFPKPQAVPAATPPAAPVAAPVAPVPAPAATPPAPVPPASTPIMNAPMQTPPSPEAVQRQYMQSVVNGNPQIPGMVPAPAPVPSPGLADTLSPQNATVAQSESIREKMRLGVATPAEVQWLSQWGEHGFTAAMTTHARRVAAVMGRAQ